MTDNPADIHEDEGLRIWAWEQSLEYSVLGLEYRMMIAHRLYLWGKTAAFNPKETLH